MEVASVIGAFVALNFNQVEEVRRDVESLRTQVDELEYQLQKE